ncbi:MAG: cytochrome c [Aquificae bacterium]|nr:cytochrome c [Aquificota bacterium]
MKKILYIGLSIITSFTIATAKDVRLGIPPKTLEKYYPPNSEKYEFLMNMYKASTAFTGLSTSIREKDWQRAEKWAKTLKDAYLKIGELVPQWDKVLRKEEANFLVQAVKNKDIRKIQFFANAVGNTCSKCHDRYLASTKLLYHFPDFDTVTLEDPITSVEYNVSDYMKKMITSFKLLNVYMHDSKSKKAKKEGMNFVKRLKGLSQMCSECHTNQLSEKVYFGKDFYQKVKQLEQSIKNLNPNKISQTFNWINKNNCSKCHNVHEVPTMIREKIKKKQK